MGLRTWEYTIKKQGFEVLIKAKMKKIQFKSLVYYLEQPFEIHRYVKELSGIIGGEERESKSMVMFGSYAIRNKDKYKENLQNWIDTFPDVFTLDNYKPILDARHKIINEHIFIEDKRLTKEEFEAQQILRDKRQKALEEKQKKENAETKKEETKLIKKYPFLETIHNTKKSTHALCSANIKRLLKRKYPNQKFSVTSDSFSMGNSVDVSWYNGPTEKEIDDIIDVFQHGSFDGMTDMYNYSSNSWHVFGSSKYVSSNRHITNDKYFEAGNALGITIPIIDGKIDWNTMSHNVRVDINRWLSDHSFYVEVTNKQINNSVDKITVSRNEEKNGIEIKFPSKPDQEVIEKLKANGFRWSRFGKCWWCKYSEVKMNFAEALVK